ncbi:MAG: malonyl-CoA synthase [Alphaproteobacteria bacterium]|nr:malonyl-CoA synthase [Alphaproteobacteria bacterium]
MGIDGNLFAAFQARFPEDLSRPFIETIDGRSYSYADIDAASARFAALLRHLGVVSGDRVAAQVDKSPEAICLYLACLRAGAVYLPLNPAYQASELEYFIGDAEPGVIVCTPEREAEIGTIAQRTGNAQILTLDDAGAGSLIGESRVRDPDPAVAAAAPNDLAAILYTSGTTGRSKGAMLSHRNLLSNARTLHRVWGFRPDDVLLHALPIFHVHGLFVATNCVLLNGSFMLFLPRFDADRIIGLLPRATVMMGVPTFYTRLLAHTGLTPEVCHNMRLFISGSAPLLPETFQAFQERTGHTILERYGMTETSMITSNPLDGPRLPGTVGLPLPDVDVRIRAESGEIAAPGEVGVLEVRGPNVFGGYWRRPEKTAEEFRPDGYFVTGDLARIDENGYVAIVGRAKDLIISGGFNVYPKEVEARIDEDEAVVESAVIGVPHPDFGEAVVAVVKPAGGSAEPAGEEIIARLKGELANYKVPKHVFFVDELPRNAMGKVQKAELRARYQNALQDPG